MSSSDAAIDRDVSGCYRLSGPLNFKTVVRLYREAEFLNRPDRQVRIDLQSVQAVDSAGIALALDWTERAERAGATICWLNMPEQMARLVRVNGLEQILNCSDAP